MCFTGGFALAMMVDDVVVAPVLSQPSLPFPIDRARRRALGISDVDVERVVERVAAGASACSACASPVTRRRLPSGSPPSASCSATGSSASSSTRRPATPTGTARGAHSVLTEDLDDRPGTPTRDALDQVLDLFRTRLLV